MREVLISANVLPEYEIIRIVEKLYKKEAPVFQLQDDRRIRNYQSVQNYIAARAC